MPCDSDVERVLSQLPLEGQLYVRRIRESPPSRAVKSGISNVTARFASLKMRATNQCESHTGELAEVYLLEFSDDVLEYYDQPEALRIRYRSKSGRMTGVRYTPDFLAIRQDKVELIECKQESALERLATDQPFRYRLLPDNTWDSPPARAAAEHFGISFRIASSADTNWTLQRNLRFLEDYLHEGAPQLSDSHRKAINNQFKDQRSIRLSDLFRNLPEIPRDAIFSAMADGQFGADLERELLCQPESIWIFSDPMDLQGHRLTRQNVEESILATASPMSIAPGMRFSWDGVTSTIQNIGHHHVFVAGPDERVIPVPRDEFYRLANRRIIVLPSSAQTDATTSILDSLNRISPQQLERAIERHKRIAPYLSGRGTPDSRTIRRYLKAWKEAESVYGNGLLGLMDQIHNRGNRESRLPESCRTLMEEMRTEHYLTTTSPPKSHVYSRLISEARNRGITPPSQKTFFKFLDEVPEHEASRKRSGRKSAYSTEPFYDRLDRGTPPHGDRPFEVAHADHTRLDLELLCSKTQQNLGRPWLTLLIDAFSRAILAYLLSFSPPSHVSLMLLARDCVQRHARLPRTIVVDRGSEFESIYFEALLARFHVHKKTRPSSKARFGSVCERIFGTTNTRFIHTLLGNTQHSKNPRTMTPETDPKRLAVWTLPELDNAMATWCFDAYPNTHHSSLLATPKLVFDTGLHEFGAREHTTIPYTHEFYIMTLPHVRGVTRKIHPSKGIQVDHINYWNPAFGNLAGEVVDVRGDPHDRSLVYVFANQSWLECRCSAQRYSAYFKLRGRVEAEELHQRLRLSHSSGTRIGDPLVDFHLSLDAQERELINGLQAKASDERKQAPLAKATAKDSAADPLTAGYAPRALEVRDDT